VYALTRPPLMMTSSEGLDDLIPDADIAQLFGYFAS
jgi:hypothetical protein